MGERQSSFAYRATQWVLHNKRFIYCHCIEPDLVYTAPHGKFEAVPFCDECKGLITDSQIADITALRAALRAHNSDTV